ncbi:hypothetical protein Tco_0647766 [Tanacetum coccineum]
MDTGGSPRRQDTMRGAPAQTRSERVLEKPNEPPLSEGNTSGSGEDRIEHQFELTANVPITPHDSPLPEGYTPGSDKGSLKLQELMTMCTKLSKQVLDLEKEKDVQVVEILRLKKIAKRLERQKEVKHLTTKKEEIQTVHTLFMDGTPMEINTLVEKKYPLIKKLLEKMLNLQLEAEKENTMAFELIKLIKSMLEELQEIKKVLDLEKEKDAQAVEIFRLKKRVKRLERQRKSSTSQPKRRKYRHVESIDDYLNEEDASKQGRSVTRQSQCYAIAEMEIA